MAQKSAERQQSEETKQSRWGLRGKTVWDWLQLLIVPLVLVGIGFYLTSAQEDVRQQQMENQRAEAERELAEQRAQDAALEAYLDVMKELLLEQDLRDSGPDSSARAVANVQTLLILERVDAVRKRSVLRLLTDSHLIDANAPLINLDGASLRGVHAEGMDLSDTDLSHVNLEDANLQGTDLSGVDLGYANLTDAEGVTNEELEHQARSLKGATMPNGQKYEDWLKSKGSGEGE